MLEYVRELLRDALQLEERADEFTVESRLLGALSEFDSMMVVSILTTIEEELDVVIDEDDISAEVFETVGSLVDFIERQVQL